MQEISLKLKVLVLLIVTTRTATRDLSESERATRAAFVQKIVNKQKSLEHRIRLVGGRTIYEGNVYIYHGGRWGAVCDDSWDDAAARVVCRHLNRTGVATRAAAYGEAKRKYWMDDVTCEGDEPSITDCIFSGWGISDCDASEAAGVKCFTEPDRTGTEPVEPGFMMKKEVRKLGEIIEGLTLRLVGGRSNREGRVEVYHNNTWGSLCPDGWSIAEALAVCHHLALGFAEQALQTDLYGTSPVVLSVLCKGNEILAECTYNGLADASCPGAGSYVAAVMCTDSLADLALDPRVIEQTAHLQDVPMYLLQCAMEENCLSNTAYEIQRSSPDWRFETRRLLRFTASSLNIGNEEFRPYLPKHLWQWHLCHMHYHSMEVFATFDILDSSSRRVAEGHKASFCLEDNTCLPGTQKKYNCRNYGDQGISINCSDVYSYNIDCQWVDVTDVIPGYYTFKVAVNPHARVAEQRYDNNAARCTLRLADTYASVYGCQLERP